MKDYILEQIKYRELAGEDKRDILLNLYLSGLITEIDCMEYLNINKNEWNVLILKHDIIFNLDTTTYKTLVEDFSEQIAEQLINLFYLLINSDDYVFCYNYRIAEVGNEKYEQLYNKALKQEQGCFESHNEQYEINNRIFKLGFNHEY